VQGRKCLVNMCEGKRVTEFDGFDMVRFSEEKPIDRREDRGKRKFY
jgi:hypothetical protein